MSSSSSRVSVLVVGGCAVDEGYRAIAKNAKMAETSVPCRLLFHSAGGVGRNLADVLRKLLPRDTHSVALLSAVGGSDPESQFVLDRCRASGIETNPGVAKLAGQATAKYVAILDGNGDLATAAAVMSIFESSAFLAHIETVGSAMIQNAAAIVMDCNLPQKHFSLAFEIASRYSSGRGGGAAQANACGAGGGGFLAKLFSSSTSSLRPSTSISTKIVAIDPISTEKARRCVPALLEAAAQNANNRCCGRGLVTLVKPNNFEAGAMVEELTSRIGVEKLSLLLVALDETADEQQMSSTQTHQQRLLLPRHAHRRTGSSVLAASAPDSSPYVDYDGPKPRVHHTHNVCHATLHEASRNAVLLLACLDLDVVTVSCGGNGSIACFRASSSNKGNPQQKINVMEQQYIDSLGSDTTVLRFDRNWHEIAIWPSTAAAISGNKDAVGFSCFMRWFPPLRVTRVVKVTGAGDTFLASVVSYLLIALTNISSVATTPSSDANKAFSLSASSRLISEAAAHGEGSRFSNASLNAMLTAQRLGIRTWCQLPKYAKGALLTSAVTRASVNAVKALGTGTGATPQLVPMVSKL